jgi:ElaB/YqjD/DUF883 family membrane-anchored ribosome-binding protein
MERNDSATTPAGEASVNPGAGVGSDSMIDEAKEKARQAASEAQRTLASELRARAESSRERAADTLDSVAHALTQSGKQLRTENQTVPSDYVERFGGQLRRASDYLRSTSSDDLVRNAEDFARRQPALFLGGAFALGFLAARLIRASQAGSTEGSIPRDRSLVPQSSTWQGDREAAVSGFREPTATSAGFESDTDPSYTRSFGRETL